MKCVFSAKALQGLETSGPQTLSSRSDGLMSENKTVSYKHICPRNGGGRGGGGVLCFPAFLNVLLWLEQVMCSGMVCIIFGISRHEIYHVCFQGH